MTSKDNNILNTASTTALALIFGLSSTSVYASEEESCTPDNISGRITLNNFSETIGNANFKPLQETDLYFSCGDRLSANITGDFTSSDDLDYSGSRREQLSLSYKAGDLHSPLIVTGGYLGEQRYFEAIFASPGKRPDVEFEETLYASRIDNPELIGVSLQKTFSLQNDWKLHLNGSSYAVLEQNKTPSGLAEDRANSTTPSYHGKMKLTHDKVSLGAEAGKTENGVLGNSPEEFVGFFAQYKTKLANNVLFTNTAETLHFNNFNNQSGAKKRLTVASSNIEWQPKTNIALWGQLGINSDSLLEENQTFIEVGGRYDYEISSSTKLSAFVAADKELNSEIKGTQIGMRLEHGF